ncbi:hypothetical protein LQZ18_19550 [Lachnospiraceae bacterium ZAX-1]
MSIVKISFQSWGVLHSETAPSFSVRRSIRQGVAVTVGEDDEHGFVPHWKALLFLRGLILAAIYVKSPKAAAQTPLRGLNISGYDRSIARSVSPEAAAPGI